MTVKELIDQITAINGTRVMFKPMEKDRVLIFWIGHSPIASVFLKDDKYRIDYPKLYEMAYNEITLIVDSLDAYIQTELDQRQINFKSR